MSDYSAEELYEAEYKLQNCIRITTNVESFTTEVFTGVKWVPVTDYVLAVVAKAEVAGRINELTPIFNLSKKLGDNYGELSFADDVENLVIDRLTALKAQGDDRG